jgi:hypothetical protein
MHLWAGKVRLSGSETEKKVKGTFASKEIMADPTRANM